MSRRVFAVALAMLLAAPAPASAQPISPFLCGQNLWMPSGWDCDPAVSGSGCSTGHVSQGGKLDGVWPTIQQGGARMVRIGGNAYQNAAPTAAQYAKWIGDVRAAGAEPYVQVSSDASSAQAYALVADLNVTRKLAVRYWSIGNEPDLHGLAASDVKAYVEALAPEMKRADPSILIFAPETAWFDFTMLDRLLGGASDVTGKDANGRYLLDGISVHRYPFPTSAGAAYGADDVMGAAAGIGSSAGTLAAKLATVNAGRAASPLSWALTEVNSTWENHDATAGGYGTPSFLNGQFLAEVFAAGMKHGAVAVLPWSVTEGGGRGGIQDLGVLDLDGVPRSAWHHERMVSEHLTGEYLDGTSSAPATVKVFGARSAGQIAVMVLNEGKTAYTPFVLRLGTGAVSSAPLMLSVAAGLSVEYGDDLAAETTLLLVFGPTGTLQARTSYDVEDAKAARAPTTVTYGGDPANVTTGVLTLSPDPVTAGQTLLGVATLTNSDTRPVDLADAVIAARPPGGTHSGGPFLDLGSSGALTLAPGASVPLSQSRTISASDPRGAWYAYVTIRGLDGTWHDLGDDVPFTVIGPTDAGASSFDASGSSPDSGAAGDDASGAADAALAPSDASVPSVSDASVPSPADASVVSPGSGGCGCAAAGPPTAPLLGALLALGLRRRRARRSAPR